MARLASRFLLIATLLAGGSGSGCRPYLELSSSARDDGPPIRLSDPVDDGGIRIRVRGATPREEAGGVTPDSLLYAPGADYRHVPRHRPVCEMAVMEALDASEVLDFVVVGWPEIRAYRDARAKERNAGWDIQRGHAAVPRVENLSSLVDPREWSDSTLEAVTYVQLVPTQERDDEHEVPSVVMHVRLIERATGQSLAHMSYADAHEASVAEAFVEELGRRIVVPGPAD
jgi:hypothetical protein